MISEILENTLHTAFVGARKRQQEFLTVEDLLLYLLDDPDAQPALIACNADISAMRSALADLLPVEVQHADGEQIDVDTQPTLGFQRVIQRAIMHVQSARVGKKIPSVTGANVLVAIYGEKDSKAVEILHQQGVSRLDLINFTVHGIKKMVSPETAEEALIEFATDIHITHKDLDKNSGLNIPSKGLRLFISYSHSDTECLNRLLVHLKPLERQGLVDCWSDKKIRAGDKWRTQVEENLDSAAVAILLVSADFLASDFIVNNELPPLLMRADAKGIRILPVILKPCGFHRDKVLQNFQAINDPKSPLLALDPIHQESLYDKVAEEVHREIHDRREHDKRS